MKQTLIRTTLLLVLSGCLHAGVGFKKVEPVIDIPVVETEEEESYLVGLKFGTLGVGVDLSASLLDDMAIRLNLNGLEYTHTEEIDDVNYDGTLDFLSAGILVDYFPFESYAFRLSGGVYYNANKFVGTAKPTATTNVEINGVTYGIDDIGQLDTEISFNKVAPYLGLGWGNDIRNEGWGLSLDLGLMYHGTPKADLDVIVNNPIIEGQIRNDVEKEKATLLEEIEQYKVYPVMMMGFFYAF